MKTNLWMMAIAATMIFSACSNTDEDLTTGRKGEKVNFFVNSSPITRTVVNTSDGSTQFKDGDAVGIYATGEGAAATNVKYNVNATGSTSLTAADPASEITWTDATKAGDFYAYYPYAASNTAGTVAFTVANQTSKTDFEANDFLYAKATATGTAVNFTFSHGLALLKVVLSGDAFIGATAVSVKAQPTTTWTHATDAFAASGEATAIGMWKISNSSQEYWAVVPAQTFASGAEMFKITVGSNTYTYKPADNKALIQGGSTKFTLSVGTGQKVVAVSTDVNASVWNTQADQTGKAEKDPAIPVELIPAAQGTFSASTTLAAQTGKQNCVEGWNTVIAQTSSVDNAVIAFDGTESAMSLVRTGGSWYNGTLYYCTKENAAKAGIYTLKFKVKADVPGDLQLAVMTCVSGNVYFYENETTNTIKYLGVTADWVEKTFTFDLSKVKDSTERPATAEDLKKVLVYFTPKVTGATKFFIKDVTFIEKVD